MKRQMLGAAITTLLLAGCGGAGETTATAPTTSPTATPRAQDVDGATNTAASSILRDYGLQNLGAVEVIDRLDRLAGEDRPSELMASVRPGELQLAAGDDTAALPIPADRFYLSVAPYVDHTHDCFHHSLTTCQGELTGKDVTVKIVDTATGEVLVDQTRTTFANGFVGFWLPRDITGTIEVGYDGLTARAEISTGADAPTCLTTLHLA
jgi:hypothetical protein